MVITLDHQSLSSTSSFEEFNPGLAMGLASSCPNRMIFWPKLWAFKLQLAKLSTSTDFNESWYVVRGRSTIFWKKDIDIYGGCNTQCIAHRSHLRRNYWKSATLVCEATKHAKLEGMPSQENFWKFLSLKLNLRAFSAPYFETNIQIWAPWYFTFATHDQQQHSYLAILNCVNDSSIPVSVSSTLKQVAS